MPRPVVTVLVKGLGIGGAERLITEGAHHWDRSAFDYRVAYILPWKDQLVGDLEALDIPVTCIGSRRGLTVLTPWALRRLHEEWEPTLIHAHLPWPGILARVTSSIPVVYTEHNLATSYRLPTRLANRTTYGRNRTVTAVSAAVASTVTAYPGPKPIVISNGVSVHVAETDAHRARKELGLTQDQPLVVHVGNIRPGKGHDLLIETALEISKRRSDVRIVSVGGEKVPGRLDQLRRKVRDLGLDGMIWFLGSRRDAVAFIAASDVYVNPADVEGLPVSILEAMALRRPIVATAVGGVPSLLGSSQCGLLVRPGSPEALADGIMTLLNDSRSRQEMGMSGAQAIAANYSLAAMVKAFEDIYRRTIT